MNTPILPPRPLKPIVVPVDEITHSAENGYECDVADCPCHFERRTQEQEDVGASFLYWSTE